MLCKTPRLSKKWDKIAAPILVTCSGRHNFIAQIDNAAKKIPKDSLNCACCGGTFHKNDVNSDGICLDCCLEGKD